ncbi:uncharacterized protein LOC128992268 [Macrosteles quadrilineatus]|uniref:uncharacterized protein LOC128992268 n=1 Tax=Macrosteles quadrilineatus TaxID=74068 RepID=UPI0023E1C573|nr:uncharacterized protein LOC128992268 [Macrosteles quadrilineatus]XP_054271731.1 uncharacterized protein LOC128992268 [Macrosteles quadrilineatus]
MDKKELDKAFVILGEASESDDDEKVVLSVVRNKDKSSSVPFNKGVIIPGEASESESENEEACRDAFFARSGAVENDIDAEEQPHSAQYDTLLHKKLRDCNTSLHNDVVNYSRHGLVNGVRAFSTINQQLLTTQIQIQDSAIALGRASDVLGKLGESLNALLSTPYIPDIDVTNL